MPRTEPDIRLLVIDDFVSWHGFVSSAIAKRPGWRIVSEGSNGVEAVQKAEQLRPDLVILDIGLPKLNSLAAARQIRKTVPTSKILFLSQMRDAEVVREALRAGADGYVVKMDAGSELERAVEAVVQESHLSAAH